MITINGKTFHGNTVSVVNNDVYIDGKRTTFPDNQKEINISVDGNIQNLTVDCCAKLDITGECGSVTSKNGNIQVKGNVNGDVTNKNGNIICRDISGNAETKNGDVIHS